MVDIGDSKSPGRMPLRVQVPSQVPCNPSTFRGIIKKLIE